MKIQTLKDGLSRGELKTIHDFFNFSAEMQSHKPIEWSTNDGDILAVDWYDLQHNDSIPWTDINLIVTETYQQIVDAMNLIDYSKSYIFVTESYATPETISATFPNLNIINTFTRFVEVFEYGQSMYNPTSQYLWAQNMQRTPTHDFFCLIGRFSWLRSHLINRLLRYNISNSLVKYRGQRVPGSNAPDLDGVDYNPANFYSPNNTYIEAPWLTPAKLIPVELYKNFYFEVQHETDPYHSKGWQIPEFHLTEKTIKPLIIGVPCLMFGAVGYNQWLKDSFDIDLSLGQFDLSFDSATNNMQRLDIMLSQLPKLIEQKVSLDTKEQHAKNMLGFTKLRDFNLSQFRGLYNLIQSL